MIQRQHLQRSIFEAAIGSIKKLIDGLIEPALQRLDEVLADEQLLTWPRAGRRGALFLPADRAPDVPAPALRRGGVFLQG
jgi:hypothetical protein